ncbi:hypothetical protein Q0590_12320 [Rhodocytophaga aerolata]|uniref:Uncharacterized protein n=1 Tax=Rhodocytophaga aerolata TaxID=455078 RepID=A0ABT8R4N4_9BACT|nr:hypothetical protein [Rhodocytophaga aerolata]MDO1447044.1 hypothetical protein [Rhodocytophaga aerolata]
MEEKMKSPGGFLDRDLLLVDKEVADFFEDNGVPQIYTHPYNDSHSTGYIRYILEGRKVILLDCVVTDRRDKSIN